MKLKRIFVLLMLTLSLASNLVLADKKGLEHYFKKPQYAGFQLSPNGKMLAGLVPVEDRMNLAVINLESMKSLVVTTEREQDVNGFLWATDDRLLYYLDKDGSESLGIYAVNTDGSKARVLIVPAGLQMRNGAAVIRFTQVLNRLKKDPKNVLVINNQKSAAHPDVYKLDIMTGRLRVVQRNPGDIDGWFVGWDGDVIGAVFTDDLYSGFQMLNKETGEFEEIVKARYDEPSFSPVALTGDGENGYVSSRVNPDGTTRDKAAIFKYNFKKREMGELVFEHPVVDVAGASTSEKTRDIIAVGYAVGKPVTVYVDERWKKIMKGINDALPGTINSMTSTDEAETLGIVAAYSSQQPPTYYIYDFEKRSLKFLADSRPCVKAEEMAEIKPVEFKARDGLTLHGYLTLPPGSDGKNLPTIVNPHGGPWARDGWGYNSEIQFLASRGYAVLQVNFRGSVGFGLEHYLASRKQWGQNMQNDVTDALQWAVDEGYSDPDRVCIYGASYGGYATMAGLTYTPDLYKCGINYVGVTDLPLLFKTAPDSWSSGLKTMKELVGDPKKEKEFLQQWSPSNHADKIKVPVFMAYGRQDPRVNIKHAELMEKALKKNDVSYELMVKKNEGHGFRKQENIYDFYGRVETFLAENLNP